MAAILKAVESASIPLAVGGLLIVWKPRIGAAVTAAVMAFNVNGNHAFLILSVALIVAVFPPSQRRFLYRWQLTSLYLFAGVAKLTSERWHSGAGINDGNLFLFDLAPVPLIVWGTIAAEVALAALVWTHPRMAALVGVPMHVGIVVGMWAAIPGQELPLLAFNLLAVTLLLTVRRAPGLATTRKR